MTNCKVCDSRSKFVFSLKPDIIDVYLCGNCGLLFVRTSIRSEELLHDYGSNPDLDEYYGEIEGTVNEKVARAVENISPLLDNCENGGSCSVLDIGCGYGHFLDALKRSRAGVGLAGSEVPGRSAVVCRDKGHKIFECSLEDIKDRFFIVVLLDVIEHIPCPDETLKQCFSLLAPGGYIYIHTPRRSFWDSFFLLLSRVPLLDRVSLTWMRTRLSLGHLQLWSDKALELSLLKAGFEPVYLKADLDLSWPLDKYIKEYLGKRHVPEVFLKLISLIAGAVFIKMGTLKNKAICLARKTRDQATGG